MDTLIHSKNGKKYRLIKIAGTEKHQKIVKFTATQLGQILQGARLENPADWRAVWHKVKPANTKTVRTKDEIINAISAHILSKDIELREQDSQPRMQAAGTGTAGSGEGGGASMGREARDASRDAMAVESTETEFDEKTAKENTDPAANKAQPVAETETSGEPISMISGEELLQLTDAVLPGPMPFAWKRTYRSSRTDDIGLGVGWTHSGAERLEVGDFKTHYHDDEGRSVPFDTPRVNQRSKYIPEGLKLDRLSDNAIVLRKEGQWDKLFTRPNSTLSTFKLTQLRHAGYVPASRVLGVVTEESGYAINVSYNEQNRITKIAGNWGKALLIARDAQGRINKISLQNTLRDKQKMVVEYDYDANADLVAHRNAKNVGEQYRYKNHLLIQRTLKTGFNFYFEWDGEDSSARCVHNWGDRGIYEYLFSWDPKNNRSHTTDSRGFTTSYVYNDYGQIVEQKDNEGGVHKYRYDNGRKDAYVDPEGNTTEYFYDHENNPAGIKDALGNSTSIGYFNGKPTTFVDKDKTHWRREYDRKGQLGALVDPFNQTTRYNYNKHGLVSSVTDPMGRKTIYRWSEYGELLSTTDPNGHKRQFSYDDWGHVISTEFFIGGKQSAGKSELEYDATGQLVKLVAPNSDVTSYTYNDNDQLTRFSDPQGRTTEFIYDGLSQVVERIDPEGNRLKYEYDTERNLTAIINENGERYRFFYDGNERLIKEVGFDGRVQNYQYNKSGHLIKYMDSGQILTEFERDAVGQLLTKAVKAKKNGTVVEEKTRFQYDAKGRLLETYNQHQYITFEYNRFGNLVKEHHSDLNAKNNRVKSSMADIEYSYIWPGIRSGMTLPDGQKIQYQFDKNNLLTDVAFNGINVTHVERDQFGREIGRSQGELVTETHYDPMGRLAKQASFNRKYKAAGPVQREYDYDKFGNLEKLTDGPVETKYVYDLLNRLKKTEGEYQESFAFDPAGNLVGIDGAPIGKSDGNRLAMQGDRKFTYDNRGNLIRENRGKDGKLVTHYHYNLQNQLVKVEKDGQVTEYKYDPLGRRIEKSDEFGATKYLWASDQLAQETRNNIKKTYVYEPESFRPVAMAQDDQIYHYHLDHLGTPRELTNGEGDVVWKARYKTYGNVAVKEVEEVENNLRFQGQYFDEETGLHYNRHRYFNPNTGQFTTQDPIGLLGGLNNYQYAPNPVSWVDPFGLTCKENENSASIPENYNIKEDRYQNAILNLDPNDSVVSSSVEKLAKARNVPVVSKDNLDELKSVKILTFVCHGSGESFVVGGKSMSGGELGSKLNELGFNPDGIEAVACQRELGPARQDLANASGKPVLGGLGRMGVTEQGQIVVWNEQATTVNSDGTENTVFYPSGEGKHVYKPNKPV